MGTASRGVGVTDGVEIVEGEGIVWGKYWGILL